MSQNKVNHYTEDFKISSAKLAREGDKTIAQTARDLGVSPSTLHGWIARYVDQPSGSAADGSISAHEELKRLRKENARLKQERDILKKATAYFANDQT
jgi:transposase